jgi:septum formation protein
MRNIILASKSLRRQELLSKITTDFKIETADIDETINPENEIKKELESLAIKKAEVIFKKNPDSIVIGSDTIVVLNEQVLLKPKNKEDARSILLKLSGNTHYVYTSVAIISEEKIISFVDESTVEFFNLTNEEIEKYINTKDPYDKAGAYGIQGPAALFINKINGDYYSIMGFPISKIYHHLKKFI